MSQLGPENSHFPLHFHNCCFSNPPLSSLDNTYLCLAVMDSVLCVIFLHGRSSPQTSPSATPCLMKSLSFEAQPKELEEQPLSPMHYARSGLGTAALNGRLIAAGQNISVCWDVHAEHPDELYVVLLPAGGYNREECLRTVECYDPKEDRWSFIAPMRTPRARFQMAVLMVNLSFHPKPCRER